MSWQSGNKMTFQCKTSQRALQVWGQSQVCKVRASSVCMYQLTRGLGVMTVQHTTHFLVSQQSLLSTVRHSQGHCIHPPPPLYLQYRWEDLQPASSRYQYKVRKMSVSKKLYRKENVLLKLRNPLCNITKLHISILPSFKLSSRNFANCMLWCLCWHAVASWRSGPQYVILCCQSLLRITGTHKEEHGNWKLLPM